jgi:hypothetical protein
MANLKRIERLEERLEGMVEKGTQPKWIYGQEPEPGVLDDGTLAFRSHLSGQIREYAENTAGLDGETTNLLFNAAETLDDAHEEWLGMRISLLSIDNALKTEYGL